ncbi:hypothetical protein L2E82_13388 [Cichorium intybus]|uniref:Uncharacterized protein n=1 Tax=Cichorium intybus TaxID=13427 RepID=A0ACB9EXY0_CICIN|nr:hypothetical protein L2E82_13388 [Cichorium intybus]
MTDAYLAGNRCNCVVDVSNPYKCSSAERTKAKYLFYLLMIRIHKETKACCCYSGWMMNTCSSSATFFSNSSHHSTLSFYTPPHFT